MFAKNEIIAFWLYLHPNKKISEYHNGKIRYFWYDEQNRCFYCQTPENKVHNGAYRARGMDSWLKRYFNKMLPSNFSTYSPSDPLTPCDIVCVVAVTENEELLF